MTEIMDNNAVEEDINFAEALDQSFKKIHTGEKVKGTVCSVNDSEAIVDVGTKHTGYVPRSELTDDASKKPSDVVAVGDVLDLIVTKINDQEGIVTLSKKKVDEMKGFEEIIKAKDEGAVLEGTVNAAVKGGVIVTYAGVRVFIPASQSGLPRGAEMDSLVKTTQRFTILEVNEHRRRAVGSIKAVLKAEKDAAKEAFWETAEIGKTYKGEVKSLTSYGAFVDIGGIDGKINFLGTDARKLKDTRYQGWFVGAGVAYGYAWILGRHWNLEAEIGIGYSYTRYDRFRCTGCGKKIETDKPHHYVGPTKTAVNLVYVF